MKNYRVVQGVEVACGNGVMSRTEACEWFNRFRGGRGGVNDE
jgi:hypothetical protein